MSFNFGTPKTASFTLSTTTTAASTPPGNGSGDFKLQTQTKSLTNLFGTPTTAAATSTIGFSSATPKTTASTISFSLTTATTTSVTSALSGFRYTPSTAATTAPSKLTATLTPASTATTSAPSLSLTSTPSLSLGGTTATTTSQAVTSTATTTTAATAASTGSLTYAQLEDAINKWTIDLEEQGKFFINQAKQLNAWDNLLVCNSDKILVLNETVERVKQQQKELDQELDFVFAQQNELDELSLPLENQLSEIPITDQERFQTYQLSETIDSQLKQMSEDLKEIVEHLNESNKNEDISDPVIQVSRILNAHMNSLQWIDRSTSQISSHLEQISQLHETYKKNNLNL